ncbi:MAG: Type II secretion system protein [Clostridia bacterium 62_21]|nr:MAG: Type II secretion system protein [Clostridia bacterium 62_21]
MPMDAAWIPSLMIILAAGCLAAALAGRQEGGSSPTQRVRRLLHRRGTSGREDGAKEKVKPERRLLQLVGKCFHALRISRHLETELDRADVPLRGEEFVALACLAAFGGGLAGLAVSRSLIAAAATALLGGTAPFLLLWRARSARLTRFNERLADALALITGGLRAGFPFVQTLDMVQREIPGPVGREFGRTFQEIQLGTPTDEALADLAARVRSQELDLVVTAVLIQREVGGNLAEVLDNIAATIRERLQIKREIRALTAQGRLSGWIVGLLPLAVAAFLLLVNPGYLEPLVTTPGGRLALVLAGGSEVAGALLIRRIVTFEV